MSTEEQFDEFYRRYMYTAVEELTVGFAGIDPPLKQDTSEINHEDLDNLLGGDDNGHYHLTGDQVEQLMEMYNIAYLPQIFPDQEMNAIPEEQITPYLVQGENVRMI